MQTVKVKPGSSQRNWRTDRNYDIKVCPGLLEKAGILLKELGFSGKTVIITDSTVNKLYGSSLLHFLLSNGFDSSILQIPTGEEQKSLETATKLYIDLNNLKCERTTPIIALGGGVIGDLSGFVAATYMRGVPLVQIPTTLLAQCDSSIGGKVAVNHSGLKNLVGTFYHPRLTICDTDTLKTLSKREFNDGLAEVIKYGIILDKEFFVYLENSISQIHSLDNTALETIVNRSAAIKAGIVGKDEYDLGLRNILNYGHTIGHAIESSSRMTVWHGEAVAIGMVTEAKIAMRLGLLSESEVKRIVALLKEVGLPTEVPNVDQDQLIKAMQRDKKVVQGRIKFALPRGIGAADLT
jgi:3-dehydroquinate synthase